MQIKNRQKIFGFVAIGLVALWILDTLVFSPLVKTFDERGKTIEKLKKELVADKELNNNAIQLQARWNKMQTNALPIDISAADATMHKALDRWANTSGALITNIKPANKENDDYTTIEISADASGTIEKLSRFIHEIEKDPMAIRIESVDISSHDTYGSQLTLSLRFSGLLLAQGR